MQRNTCLWSCGRIAAALGVAIWLAGCAIETSQGPGPSPQPTADRQQAPQSRPLDPQQAQRLKAVMTPLLQKMDHPIPLNQVTITVMDDPHINAANAGGGEFYVTAGLLPKNNHEQNAGGLGPPNAPPRLCPRAKAPNTWYRPQPSERISQAPRGAP